MKSFLHLTFSAYFLCMGMVAWGQLDSVDLTKVHDRKVERIISTNQQSLEPLSACYDPVDSSQYTQHVARFEVEESLDVVWERYTNARLEEAWNNRKMRLRCLVTQSNSKAHYRGDSYQGLERGQLVFLKLKLAGGLLRLGVGFEIKDINAQERTITYCYIRNGKSEGTQSIQFTSLPNGKTQILHVTHYKSDSKFRDQRLYPYYHERAIIALHASFNHMSLRQCRRQFSS